MIIRILGRGQFEVDEGRIDHLNELRALRRGEPIRVAPTASTRTVLTTETPANVPRHFIKLHYPRRISRFNRRLRRLNIHNSIEGSRDLASVHLDKMDNRAKAAEIVARPAYINCPTDIILQRLAEFMEKIVEPLGVRLPSG